ncbi:hypothetical protein ACTNEN_09765 [Oribacterium sp. HCP28S3_H8]
MIVRFSVLLIGQILVYINRPSVILCIRHDSFIASSAGDLV